MALKQTNIVFKTLLGNSKEDALKHYEEVSKTDDFETLGWHEKYDPNADYIVHWEDATHDDYDPDDEEDYEHDGVYIELWFIYKLS